VSLRVDRRDRSLYLGRALDTTTEERLLNMTAVEKSSASDEQPSSMMSQSLVGF